MTLPWPMPGFPISVVTGEVQDSDAHAARGVGPAIDIAAPEGEPIPCTAIAATVTRADDNPIQARGKHIILWWIDTEGVSWDALYCHLSAIACAVDDAPDLGQIIGLVGQTGDADGPHIHYVLHRDGERVRPEDYLQIPGTFPLTGGEMRRTPEQQSLIDRLRGYAAELDAAAQRFQVIAQEMLEDAWRLEREEWPEVP